MEDSLWKRTRSNETTKGRESMLHKMKKLLSVFLALALTLAMAGMLPVQVQAAEGDVVITLLETTDIHGHLVETPGSDKAEYQYRMAYMAKLFEDYRAKGDTIVLNGGDTFQGTPLSNLSFGKYLIQTLDAMKFDASAVGNHEFDWGIEKVTTNQATLADSQIPMLACNIFVKETGKLVDFAKPYTIIERSGKKIAVIGWADEYSADIMAERIAPYTISEDASLVNNLAKDLKAKGEADAVIVLAHDDAQEAVEKFEAGNIDILFGGHSHQIKVGTGSNGIPYGQGNREARGFATATMTISADNKVSVTTPEYIDIYENSDKLKYSEANKADFHEQILQISNTAVDEVAPLLNQEIAELPVALDRTLIEGTLTSVMGNWITDMMRYGEDVDFAFCNDGGIRTNFEAKKLTVNDIYTVAPFGNLIYKIEMKGSQIVKLLEQVVGNDSSNMQMSGLTAKYDLTLPEDAQVFDVCLADGTPIDLEKTYTLVTNEYLATGGNKYSAFVEDRVSSVNTNVADNISLIEKVTELGKQGPLVVDAAPRFIEASKPAEVPGMAEKKTAYTGQKFNLKINGLTEDAKVVYSTSNKKIAAVDQKGKVTAKAVGTATITAKVTQNDTVYKLKLKVTVKNPTVKLTASTKQLTVGKAFTFQAKAYGLKGDITWTSSDKKVAAVTAKGKVTAKAAGTTTIRAEVGGKSVSCKLTVKAK